MTTGNRDMYFNEKCAFFFFLILAVLMPMLHIFNKVHMKLTTLCINQYQLNILETRIIGRYLVIFYLCCLWVLNKSCWYIFVKYIYLLQNKQFFHPLKMTWKGGGIKHFLKTNVTSLFQKEQLWRACSALLC